MYLERSMFMAADDSGGGLVCRTTSSRAGDTGGDIRESAAGADFLTRSLPSCAVILMLTVLFGVDVAGERLVEQGA